MPPYYPALQLGSLPSAVDGEPEPLATATPPGQAPASPLFVQALAGIPARAAAGRRAAFQNVLEPFSAAAFAWDFADSGAGISPLGIAFPSDGQSVIVSGGAGRNSLYRFSMSGGQAVTPLATLDVPIYDMTFDSSGRLWATTGGGPLVELDPQTGAVLQRLSDGVTFGLAFAPGSSVLYVATHAGVEAFDPVTGRFEPFSSTRVHGLAVAPDGALWGTSWPYEGQVIRFEQRGRAEVMLELEHEAEGLALGQPGTLLAGLLFVSHENGLLTMVDLASLQTVAIASGGTRGDFLHVAPDGRLFVTQSTQVDVFWPITPPHVVASDPVDGSSLTTSLNTASLVFDVDMLPASAADPANYRLSNLDGAVDLGIGGVSYDPQTRTARLQFETLPKGCYELVVAAGVAASSGKTLEGPYTSRFVILEDVSASLAPTLANTRLNRLEGTVSFEASVTNTAEFGRAGAIGLRGARRLKRDASGPRRLHGARASIRRSPAGRGRLSGPGPIHAYPHALDPRHRGDRAGLAAPG